MSKRVISFNVQNARRKLTESASHYASIVSTQTQSIIGDVGKKLLTFKDSAVSRLTETSIQLTKRQLSVLNRFKSRLNA